MSIAPLNPPKVTDTFNFQVDPDVYADSGQLDGTGGNSGVTVTGISADGQTFTHVDQSTNINNDSDFSNAVYVVGHYLSFYANADGTAEERLVVPNQDLIDAIQANEDHGAKTPLSDTFYYQVTNSFGESTTDSVTFDLEDVAELAAKQAPYSSPLTLQPNGTAPVNIGGLSVEKFPTSAQIATGTDNSDAHLTTTVSVFDFDVQHGDGSLSINPSTEGTGSGGTITVSSDGHSVTIDGTQAQINADLQGLSYQSGASGKDYITFQTTDGPTQTPNYILGQIDVACFATGTLIATDKGDVAVEMLRAGNLVLTAEGEALPIRWLGTRTFACARHPKPERVWPVRIAAGAFGEGLPRRDLTVSPDHAIAIRCPEEVLVPAKCLVNGATVTQEPTQTVTYWHVELDRHAVILAEGLRAESYLDTGNRASFSNGGVLVAARPDFSPGADGPHTTADYCRPYVDQGSILTFARTLLRERAQALGWRIEPFRADLRLVADGVVHRPEMKNGAAFFTLPAAVTDLRLVSGSFVPQHMAEGRDDTRQLGVLVRGLALFTRPGGYRAVALDDPALGRGFHPVEQKDGTGFRWTDGDARLDPALWAGCTGSVALQVNLFEPDGLVWQPPVDTESEQAA